MEIPAFVRRFRFVGILTVVSVYLLILVGGIVRSTGSGMGCPDWPKCFGSWIPPTQLSQLPTNYKEVYTAQRVAKNQKLARTLERLGFKQVAGEIFAHPTQYIETDFNATKTWIEYLNRVLGALIGVFVFLTVVFALPYWQRDRKVFWLALDCFILTGFQGWLGSLVVSTNLLPIMVTIHMGLALLIVALLLYAVVRSQKNYASPLPTVLPASGSLLALLWLITLLTFGQIVLGTQVREEVDVVAFANNYLNRAAWVEQLGLTFKVHRTFSAVLLLLNLYAAYRLYRLSAKSLHRMATLILAFIGVEILAGITLAYLAFPAAVQPVHLTVATLLFGAQFLTIVTYRRLTKLAAQVAYPGVVA
ncbi:cytochrome c oxidase assembly protein subunit 15 [Hymenobacter daecheongensis DSM 21074]|uniref:Cytochrome c oxidase assembly protein subunit 15 n=1 Tax=Hymenobacter daecheongensis DSM 21074 TaxID=1121955 RepID=A0A1M6C794_9BACT|nr:COX15/CtaA family protein [Hymenobacter daecheongensis]SHI56895.1 cytochrome c oxidase assembly protein subunit 15 [Hymenobacter daecheongensis DSM 21074]